MTRMPLRPLLSLLAGIALLCCAGLAQAQFVWIAPNGTRQYSDQPPPPGTPASKILKAPGRAAPRVADPAGPAGPAAPVAAAPKPFTLAERERDYRKRAQERDEAERKAAEQVQAARAQRDYCDAMRKAKRLADSGVRITEMGDDGRQRFLTDDERAGRAASAGKALADCR